MFFQSFSVSPDFSQSFSLCTEDKKVLKPSISLCVWTWKALKGINGDCYTQTGSQILPHRDGAALILHSSVTCRWLCRNTWHRRHIWAGLLNTNKSYKEAGDFCTFQRPCSGKNTTAPGDRCGNILKSPLAWLVEEEWRLASRFLPRIENQWSLKSFSSWIRMSV